MTSVQDTTQVNDPALCSAVFLAMYAEQCDQARHYETQHLTVLGLIVAAAVALVGLTTYDQQLDRQDLFPAACVVLAGALGFVITLAYYTRTSRHGKRAEELRLLLDSEYTGGVLQARRTAGDEKVRKGIVKRYSRLGTLYRLRLHQVWFGLSAVICGVGLVLFVAAIANPREIKNVHQGQTMAEVEAALGHPDVVATLDAPGAPLTASPRILWNYGNLKVWFAGGKVIDIQ